MKFPTKKKAEKPENKPAKVDQGNLDRLFSINRKLEQRLQKLESDNSILKRDINRVERNLNELRKQPIEAPADNGQQADTGRKWTGVLPYP